MPRAYAAAAPAGGTALRPASTRGASRPDLIRLHHAAWHRPPSFATSRQRRQLYATSAAAATRAADLREAGSHAVRGQPWPAPAAAVSKPRLGGRRKAASG